MSLSDEQINFIQNQVNNSGLSIPDLKDDLIDHFCCFIENEMNKGLSFNLAYAKAFAAICPGGFKEIQNETIYLLNFKRIMLMKKLIYSIGLLSALGICVGWMLIMLPSPAGRDIFNYSFLAFLLIFLPLLTIDRYKLSINKAMSEKLKLLTGLLSGILMGLAVIFKIMHLPGANTLVISSVVLFSFGFLPFFFFKMYKKSLG